jgi:hypothetical protein
MLVFFKYQKKITFQPEFLYLAKLLWQTWRWTAKSPQRKICSLDAGNVASRHPSAAEGCAEVMPFLMQPVFSHC